MKHVLAIAALILAVSSTAAPARSVTTTVALDTSCDKFDVTITKANAVARDAPSCAGTYGGGLVATVKGFGKSVLLALQDSSQPGVQFMLELSYPFTDGGAFKLYQTTDGVRWDDALDGTYTVITNGRARERGSPAASAFHR